MTLFKIEKDGKAKEIHEKPFKLEKELQKLCEDNLENIFGLELVKSEFSIHNFRIDTLAFDPESKSFAIIEYKRDRNFSVVDQGFAYLSFMLSSEADFILEYNEKTGKNLKRADIDRSQYRVIFVSPSFTNYQKTSINFKDLPIELLEVTKYDNNTVNFVYLQPTGAAESIKTISGKNKTIEKVSKVVKVYTEEDHLNRMPDEVKELYQRFKEAILNVGNNITIKPTKLYIGFVAKRNITDVQLQKKTIKIWINLRIGELDDPKNLARDVSNTGHWGNGDYEIQMKDDENLEYIISLIKQSYRRNSQ